MGINDCPVCEKVKDQYLKYCSQECRNKDIDNAKYYGGVKQEQDSISKTLYELDGNSFESLLNEILNIHNSKKEDYSETSNRFSNFEYSDFLARPFPNNHKSFAVLVGTKLARLAVLLTKEGLGGKPNNESIDDSFKDLATYCVIWWHYYREGKK